jgi:hypothetical protein
VEETDGLNLECVKSLLQEQAVPSCHSVQRCNTILGLHKRVPSGPCSHPYKILCYHCRFVNLREENYRLARLVLVEKGAALPNGNKPKQ